MTATRFCDRCQQWVPERGLHNCVKAKSVETPAENPAGLPAPGPTHGITHGPTHAKGKKSELRKAQTYRWRRRYPDRWKQYHADYMRGWRARRAEERAQAKNN
jgi:hypothetical protein